MKTRPSDPLVLPPPRHPERASVSCHQLLFCGTVLLDVCVVVWVVTQVEADLDPAERLYPTWQSCSPSGSFHNNNGGKKREKEEVCECVASRSPPAHVSVFSSRMSSLHLLLSDNKCDAF